MPLTSFIALGRGSMPEIQDPEASFYGLSPVSAGMQCGRLKNSSYLKEHGLQSKEDFSKEDRERRQQLWPEVQEVHAVGRLLFSLELEN